MMEYYKPYIIQYIKAKLTCWMVIMNQSLTIFSLDNILNKMSDINARIMQINNEPFPNKDILSDYRYQKRSLHFNSIGGLQGGYPRLITSVIDFSFIRSIVAHTYSPKGPPCYDPPSLFLLDLFHYIDEFADLQHFLKNTLHDTYKGRGYRTYAGIRDDRIPCQGTFSNFRKRLGPVLYLYNEIFHTLVEIFRYLFPLRITDAALESNSFLLRIEQYITMSLVLKSSLAGLIPFR